jgi:hypothetical protein
MPCKLLDLEMFAGLGRPRINSRRCCSRLRVHRISVTYAKSKIVVHRKDAIWLIHYPIAQTLQNVDRISDVPSGRPGFWFKVPRHWFVIWWVVRWWCGVAGFAQWWLWWLAPRERETNRGSYRAKIRLPGHEHDLCLLRYWIELSQRVQYAGLARDRAPCSDYID